MRSFSHVSLTFTAALALAGCAGSPLSVEGSGTTLVPVVSYEEALSRGKESGEAYRVRVDGRELRFGYSIEKANVEGLETDHETIVVEADASEGPAAPSERARDMAFVGCTRSYLVVQHPDSSVEWPALGTWTECDYEGQPVQE